MYCFIFIVFYIIVEVCGVFDFVYNIIGYDGYLFQFVYCDVLLQNIMLIILGEVKLVDFGIVKVRLCMMEMQVGIIKGKFYYMVFEQVYGYKFDVCIDIFVVGMVFYEVLVGCLVYEDIDDVGLFKCVCIVELYVFSVFCFDLDLVFEVIVMCVLDCDLQWCYQCVCDLQSVLCQYIIQCYGEVDCYQVVEFVQQIIFIFVQLGCLLVYVLFQQVMVCNDYQVSEDSLFYCGFIFEFIELIQFIYFIEGMLGDLMGFEDDGLIYVYLCDEDNFFVVFDVFNLFVFVIEFVVFFIQLFFQLMLFVFGLFDCVMFLGFMVLFIMGVVLMYLYFGLMVYVVFVG